MDINKLEAFLKLHLSSLVTIESLYVMGSVLKGSAHPYSDIDLCILGSMTKKQIKQLQEKIHSQFHRVLDLKIFPSPQEPIPFEDENFPILSALYEKGHAKLIFGKKIKAGLISTEDLSRKRLLNPLRREKQILKNYHDFFQVTDTSLDKLPEQYSFRSLYRYLESLIISYKEMGIKRDIPLWEHFKEHGILFDRMKMPRIDLQVLLIREQWLKDLKEFNPTLEIDIEFHPQFIYRGKWLPKSFIVKENEQLLIKIQSLRKVMLKFLPEKQFSIMLYGSLTEGLFIYDHNHRALSDFDLMLSVKDEVYNKIVSRIADIKEEISTALSPFEVTVSLMREKDISFVISRGNFISFRHQIIAGFVPKLKIQKIPNYSHFILDNMLLLTPHQKNHDPLRVYYRQLKILRRIIEYNTSDHWPKDYRFNKLLEVFLERNLAYGDEASFRQLLDFYGRAPNLKSQTLLYQMAKKHLLLTIQNNQENFFLKGSLNEIYVGDFHKVNFFTLGRLGVEGSLIFKIWLHCLMRADQIDTIDFEKLLFELETEYPLLNPHTIPSKFSPIKKLQAMNGILWVYKIAYSQGFRTIDLDFTYKKTVKVSFRFFDDKEMNVQFSNFEEFLHSNQKSIRKVEISDIDDFHLSDECDALIEITQKYKIPIVARTRCTKGALEFIKNTNSIGEIILDHPQLLKKNVKTFNQIGIKRRFHIYLISKNEVELKRYKNFSTYYTS